MYLLWIYGSIYGISKERSEYVKKYKLGLKQLETGFVSENGEFTTALEMDQIKQKHLILNEKLIVLVILDLIVYRITIRKRFISI